MTSPDPAAWLSIGALARRTGVSVRSIRHYDAHGLLASRRAANGYRMFPPVAIVQVTQVQRLLASGFSLDEIRGFPDCMRMTEDATACSESGAAQRRRLASIEHQIAELERRRARLVAMLSEGRILPLE
ncbi:MerR family transcriptional regulator [Xanthomonas sp. Kuri4-1]